MQYGIFNELLDLHRENLEEIEKLKISGALPQLRDLDLKSLVQEDQPARDRRQQIHEELMSLYGTLKSNTGVSPSRDAMIDAYLARYEAMELRDARHEVLLHCKLAPIYEFLASAPDAAWREVLRIRVSRRMTNTARCLADQRSCTTKTS